MEHPVTELVTGVDLVEQQLRVAAGERLSFTQDDVRLDGHAVEARVYAEDPARGFLPTGGPALLVREPAEQGVRVDSSLVQGIPVGTTYDPMLSKVIAWGPDRPTALARLDRALAGNVVLGVGTNTGFLRALLRAPDVIAGRLDTGLIERELDALVAGSGAPLEAYAAVALHRLLSDPAGTDPWDAADGWRLSGRAARTLTVAGPDGAPLVLSLTGTQAGSRLRVGTAEPVAVRAEPLEDGLLLTVGDRTSQVRLATDGLTTWTHVDGGAHPVTELPATRAAAGAGAHDGDVLSPMPGAIISVPVSTGAAVVRGEVLVVVEAMKREHALTAPHDGQVETVDVRVGDQVHVGQLLVTVTRG